MRDVKPENFLFLNDEPSAPLRAIDFGLAEYCKRGETLTDKARKYWNFHLDFKSQKLDSTDLDSFMRSFVQNSHSNNASMPKSLFISEGIRGSQHHDAFMLNFITLYTHLPELYR